MSKYVTRKVVFVGAAAIAASLLGAPTGAVAQPAPAAKTAKAKPAPKGKVDIAAASAALVGADVAAAAKAADDLGSLDAAAAHDALLNGLAAGLPAGVAQAALTAVALHPGPADVATLSVYAGHRNPAVRAAALAALSPYPAPGARATLLASLGDATASVRAAAIDALVRAKSKAGLDRMLVLLGKGDAAAIDGLAALADVDTARVLGEQIGKLDDGALAACLGKILLRADFGPDDARVQVVAALGKITLAESTDALAEYVAKTPAKPPRQSRKEAELLLDARNGGR
jgi:HEAT repeat protein